MLLQLKLIVLFHVSMAFYVLPLWPDSLSQFVHIGNLYSAFKMSSNINPSLDLHWAQNRINFFLHYAVTRVHLLVYISCSQTVNYLRASVFSLFFVYITGLGRYYSSCKFVLNEWFTKFLVILMHNFLVGNSY